jgi:hypothetical protein
MYCVSVKCDLLSTGSCTTKDYSTRSMLILTTSVFLGTSTCTHYKYHTCTPIICKKVTSAISKLSMTGTGYYKEPLLDKSCLMFLSIECKRNSEFRTEDRCARVSENNEINAPNCNLSCCSMTLPKERSEAFKPSLMLTPRTHETAVPRYQFTSYHYEGACQWKKASTQ